MPRSLRRTGDFDSASAVRIPKLTLIRSVGFGRRLGLVGLGGSLCLCLGRKDFIERLERLTVREARFFERVRETARFFFPEGFRRLFVVDALAPGLRFFEGFETRFATRLEAFVGFFPGERFRRFFEVFFAKPATRKRSRHYYPEALGYWNARVERLPASGARSWTCRDSLLPRESDNLSSRW